MRTVAVVVGMVMTGAVLLAGCGQDGQDQLPDRLQKIVPTDTPATPLAPAAASVIGMRTVSGPGFSLQIPSGWEDASLPGGKDRPPSFVYKARSANPASQARAGVVIDAPPASDVLEQSQALYLAKKAADTAGTVRRSALVWPGAERAVLVEWTQELAGTTQEYRQLMVQVSARRILNLVVAAPAGTMQQNRLDAVLQSFALRS